MINENQPTIRTKIDQAEQSFESVFQSPLSCAIQPYQTRQFYQRIFTPIVLLWALIFQRLSPDHTCDGVVAKLRAGGFDHLARQPHKPPLSQRQRSDSTSGFCQARKRLPYQFLEHALQATVEHLRAAAVPNPASQERPVALLDGSTLLVRPTPELERTFGRHKTRKQLSYWVVTRIVVLFCLRSGGCRDVQSGSMKTSEQALAKVCLLHQPPGCIYIADRGFGVYSILQAIRHSQGDAILRLSRPRAQKLYPQQLYPNADHAVIWSHSQKDQVDPNLSCEPCCGRLVYCRLERRGFRSQDLYLFTTLVDRQAFPLAKLVELYGLRWQVEVDLRYVKRMLDLYLLESKSVDTVRKELMAGLIAYNLLRLFAAAAAQRAGIPPRKICLSQVLRRTTHFLFEGYPQSAYPFWAWIELLDQLAQCRLTVRRKAHLEPRQVRPRDKTYPEFWTDRNVARVRELQRRFEGAIC